MTYALLLLMADDRLLDLFCDRCGTRSSIEVCPVRRGGVESTDLRGGCVSFASNLLRVDLDKHWFLNSDRPSIQCVQREMERKKENISNRKKRGRKASGGNPATIKAAPPHSCVCVPGSHPNVNLETSHHCLILH